MTFPVSGVHCPLWLPPGVAFAIVPLMIDSYPAGGIRFAPERWLRGFLGLVLVGVAFSYLATPLAAQCIVESPGGSRWSSNRPPDADVPAAKFSPLAEVNDALPRWLCFTAGYRARLEGDSAGNFQAGNSDSYLLTRFRLGVAIRPARWVRAYVELQDATAFWNPPPLLPPYQSTWDLRRAFVDLGDPEQDPISLRVGRQDIAFGHLRLVGTSYWRNASRGWDAAMLVVNRDRFRVNAWAASPVIATANGLSHHQQGNNFHGVYSSFRDVIRGSVLEPYVFWRLSPGFRTESGAPGKLD